MYTYKTQLTLFITRPNAHYLLVNLLKCKLILHRFKEENDPAIVIELSESESMLFLTK